MATPTNLPASFVAGNVLTASQMNNLRGAFRILQIVESPNDTTLRSSTTTTFADSGLTLTITPQSTSNRILCVYMVNGFANGATSGVGFRLLRGASTVVGSDLDNGYALATGVAFNTTLYHIDSPSTTSAVTYKVQFNRNQGASTVFMNAAGSGTMSRFFALELSL